VSSTDLRELTAIACAALESVARDIEQRRERHLRVPAIPSHTLEACQQALERIRRGRLLDSELDDEIHRQGVS
jgi:hypothetical protein